MSIIEIFSDAVRAVDALQSDEREPLIVADNQVVPVSDIFRLCLDHRDVLPRHIAEKVLMLRNRLGPHEACPASDMSIAEASRLMLQIVMQNAGSIFPNDPPSSEDDAFGPAHPPSTTTSSGWSDRRVTLVNIGLRFSGLAGRLLLTFYIVRVLGLEAAAIYGLTVGGSAAVVALTGLGLDRRTARRSVSLSAAHILPYLRDRLVLRAAMAIAAFPGISILFWVAGREYLQAIPYAFLVFALEPVSYELQQFYINRQRSILANVLLFIRTGGWVPVFILCSLLHPLFRSIEALLIAWSASLILTLIVSLSLLGLGRLNWRDAIRRARLRTDIRKARLIYLSEIGFFGMTFSNRFLMAIVYDPAAVGVFVFLWSLTNSIVPLVQASIFNQVSPRLLRLWKSGNETDWHAELLKARRATFGLSVALGMGVLAAVLVLLPLTGLARNTTNIAVLILMLAANIVRLQADLLQHALYSLRYNPQWARLDCVVMLSSPILALVCILTLGVWGAALEMLLTACVLLALRARLSSRPAVLYSATPAS